MTNRSDRRRRESIHRNLERMKSGVHDYGDAPAEPQYREKMLAIMQTLDEFVNGEKKGKDRETAVVVMMFKYGDVPDSRANYMSNGVSRQDLVVLMKEMIARFEGMPQARGTA